jgi:hypothetical protein
MSLTEKITNLLADKIEFNPSVPLKILKQDKLFCFSIGLTKVMNADNKGLLLKVSAMKHKGLVLITLNDDNTLYTIYLLDNLGNSVKGEIQDVSGENLIQALNYSIQINKMV